MASDEEEEEYLVHVDFDAVLENDMFNKPNLFFKVIGIDTEKPVMQIEDQVFVGDYRDVPGTTLFFEEDSNRTQDDSVFGRNAEKPLKYVCKTRKSLVMRRVFVKKKDPKDISNDIEDESLTDEDELPEVEQFPQSPSGLLGDSSRYSFDQNYRVTSELHRLQKYDIVDTKYKKRLCYIKKKPHTKVKKTSSKGKGKGKEKASVALNHEPVAGPSWLPDNIPEVNSEMVVEERNQNIQMLEGDQINIFKKKKEHSVKVSKSSSRPKKDPKVLPENNVTSIDSAVEALLKDSDTTEPPDKTRVQKEQICGSVNMGTEVVNSPSGDIGFEPTRTHVNTEEMSRLTLKCSSDLQETDSGERKPDL